MCTFEPEDDTTKSESSDSEYNPIKTVMNVDLMKRRDLLDTLEPYSLEQIKCSKAEMQSIRDAFRHYLDSLQAQIVFSENSAQIDAMEMYNVQRCCLVRYIQHGEAGFEIISNKLNEF